MNIRKIIKEEIDDFDWIKGVGITNHIKPPYFKNMEEYGLPPNDYELVLSKVYNQSVTIKGERVYDSNGNRIYYEDSDGGWVKSEYDTNGNSIYYEDSDGVIEDNR